MTASVHRLLATSAIFLSLASASSAFGQSTTATTPHLTTAAGAESVQMGGVTFVNQGLVGVGRLDSAVRDFAGETLGSFSGMALDLASWRRNPDGSYTGRMYTLPDRGPNDVGPFVGTTDYRNRVHISNLTLAPYSGAAALPQATSSQNQLVIAPDGGFLLTDSTGANFTGKDAGANVISRGGIFYPSPASGEGAGRVSLDSEAIAFARDGSFYVSDEYAAGIYHFDAAGRQIGAIQTVPAILPRIGGAINFNGAVTPETGRRNNQGLEALAITPSGDRLVTILQSATVQDTNGSNQQTRNNTRILVYDISGSATLANPIGHYVLQLPVFTQNGGGGAPNRTAAQSEMLALNDSQYLVLARDGIGRGSGASATNSPVFKSVLLVDTTGATNLAGTGFETGTTPIAANGTLASGMVPVQQVELVNMLNPVQLNRFGMNLNTAPSNATSLSEKWEALGLAPVLEEAAPQDFFLLVGNDNDFLTANGFINGQPFNAGLTGAGGTGSNDSVILVYRLTLPTYVDPEALAERGIAVGLGRARPVRKRLLGPGSQGRERYRRRAIGIPLHGVGTPCVVVPGLVIIIKARHILQPAGIADELEFLAELVLAHRGQAVAGEGRVRPERARVRAEAVVILVLLQIAIGRDRAQLDLICGLPVEMQAEAVGFADARLLRHADVDRAGAVRLHLDEGRERRCCRILVQKLNIIAGRLVIAVIRVELGAEIGAGLP